jgi:hypothetical protein
MHPPRLRALMTPVIDSVLIAPNYRITHDKIRFLAIVGLNAEGMESFFTALFEEFTLKHVITDPDFR